MIRQFNRLFPMKKSECLASNSLKTQPGKPCFNNFDFNARLSISKTGCQFASTCRSSVDVYRSALSQNKQHRNETELLKTKYYFMKHYI